jgi:hypothetical protein
MWAVFYDRMLVPESPRTTLPMLAVGLMMSTLLLSLNGPLQVLRVHGCGPASSDHMDAARIKRELLAAISTLEQLRTLDFVDMALPRWKPATCWGSSAT